MGEAEKKADPDDPFNTFLTDLAGHWYYGDEIDKNHAPTFSLEVDGINTLGVQGTYTLSDQGILTLSIESKSDHGGTYGLNLIFTPTIQRWREYDPRKEDEDFISFTEYAAILWSLSGIEGREYGENG